MILISFYKQCIRWFISFRLNARLQKQQRPRKQPRPLKHRQATVTHHSLKLRQTRQPQLKLREVRQPQLKLKQLRQLPHRLRQSRRQPFKPKPPWPLSLKTKPARLRQLKVRIKLYLANLLQHQQQLPLLSLQKLRLRKVAKSSQLLKKCQYHERPYPQASDKPLYYFS